MLMHNSRFYFCKDYIHTDNTQQLKIKMSGQDARLDDNNIHKMSNYMPNLDRK